MRAYYVRSPATRRAAGGGLDGRLPADHLAGRLGANERIRRAPRLTPTPCASPSSTTRPGSNSYTRAQSASIVRGIQRYHVLANGWDDIGYNFLVDKYGQVFEGRFGGVDRNVVGAHAQGFNQGSTGVALIGNYDATSARRPRRRRCTRLLAWRLDVAHVDPMTTRFSWRSTGNPKFPPAAGHPAHDLGHRDTGYTSCPGSVSTALCPRSRARCADGLPKLYFPTRTGAPGRLVRFTGTLTEPLPWSVIVSQLRRNVIAHGQRRTGPQVDWTWDARTIPAGRYVRDRRRTDTCRPATGFVAGAPSRRCSPRSPTPALITPNGDGRRRLDGRPLPATASPLS